MSVIRSSLVLENFHIFLKDSENTFNMLCPHQVQSGAKVIHFFDIRKCFHLIHYIF